MPVPECGSAVANVRLTSRRNDWSYVSVVGVGLGAGGVAASRCAMTVFPFVTQPGESHLNLFLF